MSGLDIHIGQKYVGKRQAYGQRRVVEITGAGYTHVSAEGWQQERTADGWVEVPGTRRRTRLLTTTLRDQYELLEEGS